MPKNYVKINKKGEWVPLRYAVLIYISFFHNVSHKKKDCQSIALYHSHFCLVTQWKGALRVKTKRLYGGPIANPYELRSADYCFVAKGAFRQRN